MDDVFSRWVNTKLPSELSCALQTSVALVSHKFDFSILSTHFQSFRYKMDWKLNMSEKFKLCYKISEYNLASHFEMLHCNLLLSHCRHLNNRLKLHLASIFLRNIPLFFFLWIFRSDFCSFMQFCCCRVLSKLLDL